VCPVTSSDILAIKNVHVRLIIFLIQSPRTAAVASILQLPNNLYNEKRDSFLYRSFSRLKGSHVSTRASKVDLTRTPRNRTLRLRLLHVETTIEIISTAISVCSPSRAARTDSSTRCVCAWRQGFVIFRFGISLNGHDPPSVSNVLLNAVIQVVAECAQSLCCNLYYVVIMQHPVMSVPLLRIRGFSLIVTMITIVVWCECVSAMMPSFLGHRAHSSVNWEFLTQANVNMSALCAAYPEAVGFAEKEC
jgi:hypothetical protein